MEVLGAGRAKEAPEVASDAIRWAFGDETARDRVRTVLTPHASTDMVVAQLGRYIQADSPRSHTEGALRDTNVQARTGAGSTRVLTLIFVAVGVLNRTPQSQTAGNSGKAPRSLLRQVKDPLGFGLL